MQCAHPITLKRGESWIRESEYRFNTVPCGRCGACRHNRVNDWAFRLKWEMRAPTTYSTAFVTLTYAPEHETKINQNTGELLDYPTLVPDELQKFWKRLRKYQAKHFPTFEKLRYFAIGEYGTRTIRPHYHALIFNLHPSLCQINDQLGKLRINRKLTQIWGLGSVDVGTITEASIKYVATFHMLPNDRLDQSGRIREYATMSRNPGLGLHYVQKNTKLHQENLQLFVHKDGFKHRLPRYYKEKIFTSEPERLKIRITQKSQLQQNHLTQVNHLAKLGYADPENEIHNRLVAQSNNLRKNAENKGKV